MGLSSLSHAALLIDRDGRILASNAAARRIFGCHGNYPDGPDGRPDGHLISKFIPDLTTSELQNLLRSRKRLKRRELQGLRSDGSQIPLRVGFSPVRSRRAPALLLAVSDLTVRKSLEATVRDGRYRLLQLTQVLPHMLWTCNPDGSAEYFGPQWIAFTGVALDAQLGSGWLNQTHSDDRPSLTQAWNAAVAGGVIFKAEFRVRRYDGEYHWFESTVVPVRDRGGVIVRWVGISNDIHEAHENRIALIEERDRFARLGASVPGALYAYRLHPNGSTSFPLASPSIRDFVGVSAEELARSPELSMALVHPDDRPRLRESILKSAATLEPLQEEWRVLHPRKGEIWAEAHSVPTREADGATLWYGIIMDVTQRKHAEEELQRSQARLQAAVMASGIGTWIWDVSTDRWWWDDVLLKMFDRTRAEIESGGEKFVQPEDLPLVASGIAAIREGRMDTLSLEYRTVRHDAALQWIAASGRVERDAAGRMTRVTGACMDITAHKRTEEAQRHSQKIEALGTLAGGIAHDFNNLLLAIAGNTRLAMADLPQDHIVRRNLAEIDKASARATNLVQQILAFSHQTEPRREIIQLRPTIEEALRLLRATLSAMIEIKSEFAGNAPAVDADSTQIHQIIMNLITNAAHAIGDEAGTVNVSLDGMTVESGHADISGELRPGVYARICVADTGCGMDKATLERIFDPFFTTKPVGQGTGLGLSVVHGIVRSHEGVITVDSEPAQGTIFRLYFPAATRPGENSAAASQLAAKGRGQRVMYVDDEDSLVYLVTRTLQGLGYEVSGFTDPAKALQAFAQGAGDFDVVVTDVSMPGMSGFNLARALLQIRPDLPVLMTSGYVRPQDREAAQQLGVRDLILKPNTIEELGRALERLFAVHTS